MTKYIFFFFGFIFSSCLVISVPIELFSLKGVNGYKQVSHSFYFLRSPFSTTGCFSQLNTKCYVSNNRKNINEENIFQKWEVEPLWTAKPYSLLKLPFNPKDMFPFLSEEAIFYHYSKHHANYVKTLNNLAEKKKEIQNLTLEEIIENYDGPIFNNAAQIWNHDFFWKSIRPNGKEKKEGNKPYGEIEKQIKKYFVSFDLFKEQFIKTATGHFGSGWIWVILNEKGMIILDTHDAYNPIKEKLGRPILVLDVWEHSYYVDYRNNRTQYVKEWFNKINWDFANENLSSSS